MIKKYLGAFLVLATIVFTSGLNATVAMAASLTTMSDTLSTVQASTVANHTIVFTTPSGVDSGETIILTFDNGTSIHASLDFTDIDLADDGVDVTLAATPSGATWGVVRDSATQLTFTNGTTAVAGGSVITIEIGTHATTGATGDQQITNGPAGLTTLVFSGSFGDTGTIAMRIIANNVVAVSATVDPTLTFALGSNTVALGTLSSGSASSGTHTISASTNAAGGYNITYNGPTLTSGGNTIAAYGASQPSTPGTAGFGINLRNNATPNVGADVTQNAGTCGYAANYGTADAYSFVASTTTTITAVTAPADCVYTASYIANISTTTPAGSYTTNLTYVATGTF